MTWFKVDDNLAFHPKVLAVGNAAMGLWVRAGSWSAQQLTDGEIPDTILPSLGTRREANALVAAGLWTRGERSFSFHQWNEEGRQPSREKIEAERAAAAERQRKYREGKVMSQRDESVTNTVSDGVSDGEVTGVVTPTPTRPDPTRPITGSKEPVRDKRGSRVPSNFKVTAEMRQWAQEEVPLVDVDKKLAEWVDYWSGVPGAKGVKLDWLSTWRNGMRKQQEFAERDAARLGPVDADAWMRA